MAWTGQVAAAGRLSRRPCGARPWTSAGGFAVSASAKYEANFRTTGSTADVLPRLTADDLKDIGVSAVGDRRRLLAAIAALAGPTSDGRRLPPAA